MKVRIHRGADEIGGSCVELESAGKRLVLDVGRPLWADTDEHVPLPPVAGLSSGDDASIVGVIVSHSHLDHYGLLDQVASSVPVYTGEVSARMLREAAFFSHAGIKRNWTGYLSDRKPLRLGPFTVTPFLVDHSAFDAFALLVEAEGRRLFYSGDLRGHGLQGATFDRLLDDPPECVNALLLEGTRVGVDGVDGRSPVSEAELESEFADVFRETEGIVLVAYSAQNIDRLQCLYRATQSTGSDRRPRQLVIDPYGDAMTKATGSPQVPSAGSTGVSVYVPQNQRVKIKQAGEFDRVNAIRRHRIFPNDLRELSGSLVLSFRPSMAKELARAKCLEGAHLIWSMWPGYLAESRMDSFKAFLDRHSIATSTIHASGHAAVTDLQRLSSAIGADRVVPIHTSAPERFSDTFDGVERHYNGEWWSV